MSISTKAAICLFGVLMTLPAQEPTRADPVIRVSVDLVQVDAVVKDSSGRHVRDLRADDFEILEDGKAQKITHFSFVPVNREALSMGLPERAAKPMTMIGGAAPMLAQGQVQRAVVLLTDDLGISSDSMPRVKKALADVVDQRLMPGDLVSLMSASGGTGAMQQFTSDRRQLHAAIERIHWFRGRRGMSAFEQAGVPLNRRLAAVASEFFRYGTLSALSYAIEGLRQMPGRKALVFLTEGMGIDPLLERVLDRVIDDANRAGVAIYPVDVRGVTVTELTAADDVPVRTIARVNPALSINSIAGARAREYENSRRGMMRLSGETGGVFLEKDNDIGALLASAVAEVGDYYLIGYQPQRGDYGSKFHRIQVHVKKKGFRVTTRSGFQGSPATSAQDSPRARESQLALALASPFRGAIPTPLVMQYGPGAKNPKTGKHEVILRGQVLLDARALDFVQQPAGRHRAVVDAVVAAYGADGKAVASQDRTFTVDLDDAELKATLESGLFYEAILTLPKAGAYQFRIAMRDAGSGKTGSANRFLEVPDFDRPNLTLTSMVFADNVKRIYGAGAPIAFRCDAFGAASPVLRFEVRLYRGPERIYSGPVLNMQPQDAAKPMSVSGNLRLPDTLPAGDYAMELVVRDDLRIATQWAEFALAAR